MASMLLPDRTTFLLMLSAVGLCLLCLIPATQELFPLWVIRAGMEIGDTLFHELGHSLFGWLFGIPNFPAILTLFGRDQASGITFMWERSWLLQLFVFIGLGYACYWGRQQMERWFWWVVLFISVTIFILSFTDSPELIVTFMGHGGSMVMGGFFLFRGWLNLDSRNGFERWLNGFFGFYLLLNNIQFGYNLAYDPFLREEYSNALIGQVGHHDFMKMTELAPSLTVGGIAVFTIVFGVFILLAFYIHSQKELDFYE